MMDIEEGQSVATPTAFENALSFLEKANSSVDGTPDGVIADDGDSATEMSVEEESETDNEEVSEEADSSDGDSGRSKEPSGEKKPGRWAKSQQKLRTAQDEVVQLQKSNDEALGHISFWKAETQALEQELAQRDARDKEYGIERSETEIRLEAHEAQARRLSNKEALDKENLSRRKAFQQQSSDAVIIAEVTALATKAGIGPKQFAAFALEANLTPSEAFDQLQAARSSATLPPARTPPTTITRGSGTVPRSTYKPGTTEHATALLEQSPYFRR